MQDSRFWRAVAIAFVVAILYVGHGLHNDRGEAGFSIVNAAHAGGVGVHANKTSDCVVFTTSDDGTKLFAWGAEIVNGNVRYLGSCGTDGVFSRSPASKR